MLNVREATMTELGRWYSALETDFDEIGCLVEAVVSEAICVERLLTMLQHHILACHHQFLGTIVGSHVTIQR